MKILLIACGDPAARAPRRCDSDGFARSCEEERTAGIVPIPGPRHDASGYRLYTGTGPAALQTAQALFFFEKPPERIPSLDDVPIGPFCGTKRRYPLWLWRGLGQLQWRMGSRRQPETRKQTVRRAEALIERLEGEGQDCVLIARGLTLKTVRDVLYRRGYCLQGGGMRIRPLDRIRATKQTLHCGGCIHNCMLDNPGCGIGMTKARERNIRPRSRAGSQTEAPTGGRGFV